MEHFLDIIIPEYNCKEEFMKKLLHSIARQKDVDFNEIGLIIVNDNSKNKIRKGLFKNYPKLNIEYYLKDVNEGVGMTRQYGLDRSTAKYVTFIDQDDELYGNDSLSSVINYLKINDSNSLMTQYIEEVRLGDGSIYPLLHDKLDGKEVLHGFFVKRKIFDDYNIKFIDGIKYHDDSYIRRVILFISPIVFLKKITYVWKANTDSIVRRERKYDYMVETYDDYFKAMVETNKFANERSIYVAEYQFYSVLGLFIILESKYFDYPELIEKKKLYERELYKLICANNFAIELYLPKYDLFYKKHSKGIAKSVDTGETLSSFIDRLSIDYPEYKYERMSIRRKIDFIISCIHNDIKLIKRVLDSVQNQMYINKIEIGLIFVVNKDLDVSSFDLDDELISLSIKFVTRESSSFIFDGYKYAEAEYVSFIDDTDMLNGPYFLFQFFNFIKNNKKECLFLTNYYKFNSQTNERGIFNSSNFVDLLGLFIKKDFLDNSMCLKNIFGIYSKKNLAIKLPFLTKTCKINECSLVSYVDYNRNFIPNTEEIDIIRDNFKDYLLSNYDVAEWLLDKNQIDKDYFLTIFYICVMLSVSFDLIYDNNCREIIRRFAKMLQTINIKISHDFNALKIIKNINFSYNVDIDEHLIFSQIDDLLKE